MKIGKTILAFLLATLTLTLVACRSEKKNLTESSGDDVSSRQSQSQPQESFSFTTTDLDGHEVSFEDYSDAKALEAISWGVQNGYITLDENSNLRPTDDLTRAEMAEMIYLAFFGE